MSQLERHVATVRSREATTRALRALATGATVIAAAAIAAIVLEKLLLWRPNRPSYVWLGGKPGVALAAALLAAVVAGIVIGVRRRPSAQDAAVQIDEQLGTKEKFSTALYLQRHPQLASDPFAQAAVMDAVATANGVDLAGRFPIRFPRSFGIAVALGLVAFGLSHLRTFDLFGREEKARLAEVQLAKQVAAKKEIEQVLTQINMAAPDVQAQDEIKLAKQKLQDLTAGTLADAEAGQRTAAKAQQALNDAAAFKEKIKDAQAFAKAKNNQKLLASLDDPRDDSPVSKIQKDIKQGDMDAAIDKMSKLTKQFDKMDEKEKEKAADQMAAMTQQMKQAAASNQQAQALQQQMQQAGISPQQVQQLQQLMQQAAQGNQQAAQQAQQQAQQMMQQAGATPQQMQQAQQLAQQMQGVQNSQALMQQMQQAAQQMAQAMQQQAGAQQQPGAQQQQGGQQQQAGQQGGQQQQSGQQQQGGQQQGQQAGQQKGQQQGQQGGQQSGQQPGQQQGGQQPGGQQGGQQQGGMNQGAQQMNDAMEAIKQDMKQMQAAQRGGQQGGQAGGSGGQQGGGKGQGGQQGQGNGPKGGGTGEWKQGDPAGKQGGGMGAPGQGAGGKAPVEEAPFDFKEEISKSQNNDKGQVLAQTLVKADAERGESTAQLREVVRSNLQESTDEVDNQRISRQAQKAVKDYFTGITGQAQPEASATPAAPSPSK